MIAVGDDIGIGSDIVGEFSQIRVAAQIKVGCAIQMQRRFFGCLVGVDGTRVAARSGKGDADRTVAIAVYIASSLLADRIEFNGAPGDI